MEVKQKPTTEEADNMEKKYPQELSRLRQKLGLKAKQEAGFRFYSLYGLISEWTTLVGGWEKVKANDGAAGVDGISIGMIESEEGGVAEWLKGIQEELRSKTYRPQAVKRVYIPKADGSKRPLGIPVVKDRVVQAATLLILEPIFEADFEECSYGFRPNRSAHDALGEISKQISAWEKCDI